MRKIVVVMLACLLIIGTVGMASATKIEYTASGSNPYTLVFDVFNTTGSDIEWFSVYFGVTSDGLNFTNTAAFSNFVPDFNGVAQPAGWWSYSFEPTAIDNPGTFNSDALGSGIASGSHLGGFTVTFNMTSGTYDHLYYEVGNFNNGYTFLDDGYTQKKGIIPGLPEPATMVLLMAGLAGLGIIRKKM
jgi:hypothetical protein